MLYFLTYTVQARLLMLKCLDVAYNDDTLFLIRLSKRI